MLHFGVLHQCYSMVYVSNSMTAGHQVHHKFLFGLLDIRAFKITVVILFHQSNQNSFYLFLHSITPSSLRSFTILMCPKVRNEFDTPAVY